MATLYCLLAVLSVVLLGIYLDLYQNCPTKQYVKFFHFKNATRTILLKNGSSSPDSTYLPVIIPIIQDPRHRFKSSPAGPLVTTTVNFVPFG